MIQLEVYGNAWTLSIIIPRETLMSKLAEYRELGYIGYAYKLIT